MRSGSDFTAVKKLERKSSLSINSKKFLSDELFESEFSQKENSELYGWSSVQINMKDM